MLNYQLAFFNAKFEYLFNTMLCHPALVVGFVNTSIMVREGDNTRVCLRVLDPPPAVTISETFRLQINLQKTCKAIY